MIEAPVFLIGSERSGTSLLRLMLDHHPGIALNSESDFLVSRLSDRGEHPDMARYHDWLRDDRAFQHSGFRIDETLDYAALVNSFLAQKRSRDAKPLVGATVHNAFSRLHWIWPRARYIYLVRDGRDVATSVMRMGWAGNVYIAADRWLEAERERDALLAHVPAAQWHEVRYEDLVTAPRSELERLCAFLGLAYSEHMLDYVKTSTYEAPDARLCYQWKKTLGKRELQHLEDKLGARLQKRGYALSDHPRVSVSPMLQRYLRIHSRLGAYRFRIRRYGALLSLQETLARRLGLEKMRRAVMGRMNEITNRYMR